MTPSSRQATDRDDSLTLLSLAQDGDATALNSLVARYGPRLVSWAHGRLPAYARDLSDTDDLVQDTLIATIHNLRSFVPESEGSLLAYLRQALWNRIRDELRRAQIRPARLPVDGERMTDGLASPLEAMMDAEKLARYETALQGLDPPHREAIIARFELQYSFAEIAALLGKSSPDAARKYIGRAVAALSRELQAEDRERG